MAGGSLADLLQRLSGVLRRWLARTVSPDALESKGQELGTAPDGEVTIDCGHVLMDGGRAQVHASRDLLLPVATHQIRQRLTKPWREFVGARFDRAHERLADDSAELRVEEAHQSLLPRRELSLARFAVHGDHADRAIARDLVNRRELRIDPDWPAVLPGGRSVPRAGA